MMSSSLGNHSSPRSYAKGEVVLEVPLTNTSVGALHVVKDRGRGRLTATQSLLVNSFEDVSFVKRELNLGLNHHILVTTLVYPLFLRNPYSLIVT